jgi:hypothetical protein
MNALTKIQAELKAPKNQKNSFGGYNYRSCEDILEAVKPLLKKHNSCLTISDAIKEIGGRIYVEATVKFEGGDNSHAEVTAYAREAETKKGMDDSQITGAASSYARKYALNGLFLIDDTKDADATNDHGKKPNGFITRSQLADIEALIAETGADKEKFCEWLDVKTLADIPAQHYDKAIRALEAKRHAA